MPSTSSFSSNRLIRGSLAARLGALLIFGLGIFGTRDARAQLQVSNYTACPNQIVTVNVNWPNTTINNLNLIIPNGGSATNGGNLQTNTQFTISHPGPNNTNWTLTGSGTGINGNVTSTVNFVLTIVQPPPLTFTNQVDYCTGQSATIITNSGGNYYTVSGTQNLGTFPTNVIITPTLTSAYTGTYLVTSVGACTMTGVTNINVAPNNPLTVNASSNVCEGSSVNLSASMLGGTNWEWYSPPPQSTPISGGLPNTTLSNVTPAMNGVYTVYTELVYGSITCPRTATTQVSVVGTSPVVPAVSPSPLLCQNDKISLSASAFSATGYSWIGPCGFGPAALSSPTISPALPCNSGEYTVTAFFSNNFVTCSTKSTIYVEVVATSVPNPSVTALVCQGKPINLTATSSATNINNWIWYGPNFSAAGSPNAVRDSALPDHSGPYVVTAIYSNIAGTKTCAVSSPPQQITVITVNTVTIIPPKPVCVPENALLASSAPGANGYEWKGPNNFSYNGANATIYYPTPAYSGIYSVTAFFGSLKCPSTATVELKVNPVLNFSLIPRQQTCYNSTLNIAGPGGADSYSWTSSTGFVSSDKDLYFSSILPKDQGTYTLAVSLGPCVTKASSEVVVVKPITFTLVPKDRTLCAGDTTVLETGVTGGTENYAYVYNPPLFMDSPNGPKKVIVPQGTVHYNVMVHDIACPHFTLAHQFDVNVKPSPEPVLQYPAGRGCDKLCQSFTADVADSATDVILTIDFGGIDQYQVTPGDRITHCLPTGSHYVKVVGKGQNGCTGRYETPYPIIVDPRPGSSIHFNPEQPNTSEEVVFDAKHANTEVTYQRWVFQGGMPAVVDTSYKGGASDTTNDNNPRRVYSNYGKYPVMLITANEFGCYDTVVHFLNVIDLMSVYIPDAFTPNDDGVNDVFGVRGMGISNEGFIMDIFNRKGMNIYTTKDVNEPWDGKYLGAKCMDGVYTYKIRVVGMNGEGRKEYIGRVALIK